jgi:hypothetical protein
MTLTSTASISRRCARASTLRRSARSLTGDYFWGADASLGPDGFRPLRGTAASLPTAAAA